MGELPTNPITGTDSSMIYSWFGWSPRSPSILSSMNSTRATKLSNLPTNFRPMVWSSWTYLYIKDQDFKKPAYQTCNHSTSLLIGFSSTLIDLWGIVNWELLGMLRASSNSETSSAHSQFILGKPGNRGYPRSFLHKIQQQVKFEDRDKALKQHIEPKARRPPFISTYHDRVPRQALKTALEPPTEDICTPLLCFERGKNLADKFVRARLPRTDTPYVQPPLQSLWHPQHSLRHCGVSLLHYHVQEGSDSSLSQSFQTTIPNQLCQLRVVYLLECTACTKANRYVGQTGRTLRERMSGHRRDLDGSKNMPLDRHLRKLGHSFLKLPPPPPPPPVYFR